MKSKERLIAAIKGQEVDRLTWSPFLAYYWENQPKELQNQGQLKFLEKMGADPLMRGSHTLYKIKRNRCHVKSWIKGKEKFTVYETPIGILESTHIYSPVGNTWFLFNHPVKTKEDFKILSYIYEDMEVLPDMDKFIEDYIDVGDKALFLPVIGTEAKTSFQSLIEYWVGTEGLVYSLADYPEVVEECLNVMREKSLVSVKISAQSLAEAFIFWEDSSSTNISPSFFEKYTAPEINSWGDVIHNEGKYLIHHACGHLKGLIPIMAKTNIDIIESISPPPTGNIELWEARKELPQHIGLIGGIEPTVFLNSSIEELMVYVKSLIEKMGNKRYVLANSDSCPPGVSMKKFKLITDIVNGII